MYSEHTADSTSGLQASEFQGSLGGYHTGQVDVECHQEGIPSRVQFTSPSSAVDQSKKIRVSKQSSKEYTPPRMCGQAVGEEGYRTSKDCVSKSILKRVHRSQEERSIQAGYQSKRIEPATSRSTFQNGVSSFPYEDPTTGRVGDLDRPGRCLLTCASERVVPTPSTVRGEREGVPVQIPAVWVVNSSSSVHQDMPATSGSVSWERRCLPPLPGRLADQGILIPAMFIEYPTGNRSHGETGISDKSPESGLDSVPGFRLCGDQIPVRHLS